MFIGCGQSQEPSVTSQKPSGTSIKPPTLKNLSVSLDKNTSPILTKQLFSTTYKIDAIKIVSLPLHGVLKLNDSNITINQIISEQNLSNISYTPNLHPNKNDNFKIQAISGNKFSNISNVNLSVKYVNNNPTLKNISVSLDEDTNITFTKQLFLTAYDFSGNMDSIKIISLPTNGVLKLNSSNVDVNQTITQQNLSALVYTPNPDFNQLDSFQVQAISGIKLSNTSDINITVNNINDTPTLDVSGFKKSFEEKTVLSNIDSASSIFAIDLNKDGKLDILTTSEDQKRVVWLENIDNTNFTEHNISTSLDGAKSITGIDLDKDGDVDVLATAWRDNKVVWFENNGSEHFTTHTIDNSSSGAFGLRVADIDNDNDLDIAVVSYDDDTLSWYKNSNLNFTKINIDSNLSSASSLAIYDIDQDGYQDIVASSYTGVLKWYKQDQNGTFSSNNIYDNQDGTNSIFIDNGTIYSTNYNSQKVVQSTLVNGNFTNTILTSIYQPNSMSVYDMDGDGDDDLIVGSFGVSSVTWLEKTSNGYISHKIDGFGKISDISTTDIDSDNDEDIIASDFEGGKIMLYNSKDSIYVYENNKSVTQINATDIDGDTLNFTITGEDKNQFDINSSGYLSFKNTPDFETPTDSDKNNMYNITIHILDNNTAIKKDLRIVVQNLTRFEKITKAENLNTINDIAVHQDNIAVVSNQAPELYILKPNGTQTNITHSLNNPSAVEFLDSSLAVSFSSGDGVAIYKGNNFSEQIIDNSCDFASDIVVSDIDHDGKLDIATSCFNDEKIKWFIQQADGNFSTSSFDLGADSLPWAISVLGTNHKDFILALPDTNEIYQLENDGSENFTLKVLDDDSDGANDVSGKFAVSLYDNKLSYYHDSNKTVLNTPDDFSSLNSLAVGDIDGDGDEDIVTTSKDDGKVVWFENLGNNTYKQSLITELKEPVKVVISDYNNDGLNDIIVATETKILLLKNSATESLF